MTDYLELSEAPHVYLREGKALFRGTPDRVLIFPGKCIICLDRKFGRKEVQPADANLQLRAYLTMLPAFDAPDTLALEEASGTGFRPSALLRLRECPGSLALERHMAQEKLLDAGPSEDAEEGRRLHMAISEPLAPRDHLTPEQLDIVEQAEAMEREFVAFVLGSDPVLPFYGAIVQPRLDRKANAVFYTRDDIASAKEEINGIWDAAHAENAPRRASEAACKHCPCKALCPEFKAWVMAVEQVRHLPVGTWTDEQMDLFESRRSDLVKFIEDAHEQIKAVKAANPERLPGWELKAGNEIRHTTDIIAAFAALKDFIGEKNFTDCCSLSFTDLERVVWELANKNGKCSQKQAKEIVNQRLAGVIEKRRNRPSLVRKE